jgi:hypothetical protein
MNLLLCISLLLASSLYSSQQNDIKLQVKDDTVTDYVNIAALGIQKEEDRRAASYFLPLAVDGKTLDEYNNQTITFDQTNPEVPLHTVGTKLLQIARQYFSIKKDKDALDAQVKTITEEKGSLETEKDQIKSQLEQLKASLDPYPSRIKSAICLSFGGIVVKHYSPLFLNWCSKVSPQMVLNACSRIALKDSTVQMLNKWADKGLLYGGILGLATWAGYTVGKAAYTKFMAKKPTNP